LSQVLGLKKIAAIVQGAMELFEKIGLELQERLLLLVDIAFSPLLSPPRPTSGRFRWCRLISIGTDGANLGMVQKRA
jgi:hypothetical protein